MHAQTARCSLKKGRTLSLQCFLLLLSTSPYTRGIAGDVAFSSDSLLPSSSYECDIQTNNRQHSKQLAELWCWLFALVLAYSFPSSTSYRGLLQHLMFLGVTHQFPIAASSPIHKSEAGTFLREDRSASGFCELKAPHSRVGAARMSAGSLQLRDSAAWAVPGCAWAKERGSQPCRVTGTLAGPRAAAGRREGGTEPACASPRSARGRLLRLPAPPGRRKCIESIAAEIFTETWWSFYPCRKIWKSMQFY